MGTTTKLLFLTAMVVVTHSSSIHKNCALPYEAGPCTNYTVQWYFDMQYGGCSRFHYGGCEGNGNRFTGKVECEDVCVHPTGKDVCNLPEVKGCCGDQVTRWYHDTNQGCKQFIYGGCLGNANNFASRELCERQCVPELNQERHKCTLPGTPGPCRGNYSRWFYDTEFKQCRMFPYGGCGGNENNFLSEAQCKEECA